MEKHTRNAIVRYYFRKLRRKVVYTLCASVIYRLEIRLVNSSCPQPESLAGIAAVHVHVAHGSKLRERDARARARAHEKETETGKREENLASEIADGAVGILHRVSCRVLESLSSYTRISRRYSRRAPRAIADTRAATRRLETWIFMTPPPDTADVFFPRMTSADDEGRNGRSLDR